MSEPWRILVLNFEYPPIGGGGASATKYLFDELAGDYDLAIDLVTSAAGREREEENHSDRIRIIRLPVGKRELHYWRQDEVLRYVWQARREVRRLLKEKPYDLCHAIFGFPSGWVAYRFRDRMPYVVSLHGSDVPGFNRRFSWQYPILRPIFRRIWRNAQTVTIVSEALKSLAHETDPSVPIQVIPNGVDTDLFSPPEEDHEPRQGLITVCRLIGRKNLHLLLDALPRVRERHPEVTLTIVGEGERKTALEEQTRRLGLIDVVEFRGRVPHEELPAEYRKVDLFILPSEWEGMPITLLEAMACGLPVVVTESGGSREVVRDNGVIIPTGSVDAIAQTLGDLLGDPTRRREMGTRSREIAMEYGWKRVADRYRTLYHQSSRATELAQNP
jgi:glycosyltransferase involved in cell wall biosynthesis